MKQFLIIAAFISSSTCFSQNRITNPPERITIEIPSDTINDVILRKKATLFTMIYNQSNETLSLTWTVRHYADSSGAYGQDMSYIIPDYSITSIADNDVKVNPANGDIIDGEPAIDWMGQYDFFNYLGRYQPLLIHDVIRSYGLKVSSWQKR